VTTLPLSRPVVVTALPPGGREIRVEADPKECDALARAFGLVAVTALSGRFLLVPDGAAVKVTGVVEGTVTQTCTVSLDPFEAPVHEEVDLQFMPEGGIAAWMARHRPDPSMDLAYEIDPPDAIVDGRVDLGGVTAEFLALGLDPHPRKPGVAFEADPAGDAKDQSPFAALAKLKGKDNP
jgi:hypothetical protein